MSRVHSGHLCPRLTLPPACPLNTRLYLRISSRFFSDSIGSKAPSTRPRARKPVPRYHWGSLENQRRFVDGLATKLGFPSDALEHWYKVTAADVTKHGGGGLVRSYDGSLSLLLAQVYPEHPWDLARFAKKPHNYWASLDNQRRFVLELGKKLGIREGDYDAWLRVKNADIRRNGGGALLGIHGGSHSLLFRAVFPEHKWPDITNVTRRRNQWTSLETQRTFMIELARSLGLSHEAGPSWYSLRSRDILRHGGSGLLHIYDGSVVALLARVFPEFPWRPWLFSHLRTKSKVYDTTLRAALLHVLSELGQSDPHALADVPMRRLSELGVRHLFRSTRSYHAALRRAFPECDWDAVLLAPAHSKDTATL